MHMDFATFTKRVVLLPVFLTPSDWSGLESAAVGSAGGFSGLSVAQLDEHANPLRTSADTRHATMQRACQYQGGHCK